MGIPRASRKGKKAWRKNIDATEIETFLQDVGQKQQREPAVEALRDEELFVVDKAANDSAVPAAVLKKKKKRESKPLRSQLILDSLRDGITPVPQGSKRKPKDAGRPLPNSTAAPAVPAAAVQSKSKRRRQQQGPVEDIWADDASAAAAREADWTSHTSGNELQRIAQLTKQQQQQQQQAAAAAAASSSKRGKRRRSVPAPIAAVEIDMPGCSYNPEYEAHQDALAVAVAREYKQQLKQELGPKAPSLFAPAGYKPGDELEELLADADPDYDSEEQQQQQLVLPAAADENEIAIDAEDAEDEGAGAAAGDTADDAADGSGGSKPAGAATAAAGRMSERKTRKDRNREARRKQQEAEAEAKRQLKRQRQQLEVLPQLQQQLQVEEAERAALQERRQVVKQEKAAIQPPRLGKHKFEAPAPEVLTSDQVTGSLRQLQPCFLVTEDRFKALQKRGLIEPRKPAGRKQGHKVEYVAGERREKAEARQQEVRQMAAARREVVKVGLGSAAVQGLLGVAAGCVGKKKEKKQQGQQAWKDGAAVAAAESGLVMPLAVGGDEDGSW